MIVYLDGVDVAVIIAGSVFVGYLLNDIFHDITRR